MKVIKVNELPFVNTGWGIKGKPIIDMPEIGIVNLFMEPGEKVTSHMTSVDVLFQVAEGKGAITIGGETQIVEAGDIVVSPLQIPHALEANQNCVFSVYVIKTPNPQKSAVK
ncbi:cupin domain-containing protein [Clostridium magnum]|uniref:Cupin domain protein n=1 Tax=Clostridium magnum DSM 2767 TaxID=1121326 RepID=A0A161Y3T8_9CLOT|nr:cupin domain-containing protein [Clostridium magnum]KZL92739.1 cupin domain protein [Clostridium magnum DSM 2767]SHI24875.1 Cupin domain-containing protein [Clostridium magnum DSM 2767]